jgi:hypothetical protein
LIAYTTRGNKKKNKRRKKRRKKRGVSLKGEWEHCIAGFVIFTRFHSGDKDTKADYSTLTGNNCIHLV